MKQKAVLLAGVLALCLTGCTVLPPERAADGADWDESWVTVGGVVGVDAPAGLTAQENNDALAANGMYYATWSMGEGEDYTNEDGDDAVLYDAQVYVLLAGAKTAEEAQASLDEWTALAEERYAVDGRTQGVYNGQPFTVLTYAYGSDVNPYQRGASAFGIYRNFAVNVELSCREGFTGDEAELLADFLEHCHYAVP